MERGVLLTVDVLAAPAILPATTIMLQQPPFYFRLRIQRVTAWARLRMSSRVGGAADTSEPLGRFQQSLRELTSHSMTCHLR